MTTRDKLNNVLARIGVDTNYWKEKVDKFHSKIELLELTGKYANLLKCLFSCNDLNTVNSYAFEILFAYDFEVNGFSLEYEVNYCPDESHSIDFRWNFEKFTVYFELRFVQQRLWITQDQQAQLNSKGWYETHLDGDHQRVETIRLQNLILEKCQNRRGTPIKFQRIMEGVYNVIVVNVSELHLHHPHRYDCLLAVYGDRYLPPDFRLGVFGLCDELPENPPADISKLFEKFTTFRECIHAVMFIKFDGTGSWSRLYLDQGLEYLPIVNKNIVEKDRFSELLQKLFFLKEWSK